MLLGIPRVFGGTGRAKKTETVVEVPVAPPPPPEADKNPIQWAKAHPLQVALFVSAIIQAVRAVKGVSGELEAKNAELAAKAENDGSVSIADKVKTTNSGFAGGSKAGNGGSMQRAVPLRHESTEEALDLLGNTARKYIIVGGKGGVGKTSMSAAVATAFADRGQTTLIVSTDPAHSLSDAFGQNMSGGDPVPVMGIDNLYAQEVDPDSMKRTFKMMEQMGGGDKALASMGMEDMGLDDLNSLFDTIPPGFDEAVALVEIVKYIQGDAAYSRFERIVFDTAPTGHTLRLLALPDFLNGFFGKIISMKSKLGNVMKQFKGMFGGGDPDAELNASVEDMEELKRSMGMVRDLFRDEIQTEFVVATIPNMMAIAESKRLVEELAKEKIPVRHMFVNQVQPENDDCTFCAARFKEQAGNLRAIDRTFDGLLIAKVQMFDKEIKGAAALRTMSGQLFPKAAITGGEETTEREAVAESGMEPNDGGSTKAKAELVD
ncbi:probable arsenite translocating ATPase [Chondrus crispus]|uniref:Probable arsenite translocating ATPase n=1 Tax=Chondrus crispus TaxID=2769 RepID=R7QLH0_CHOCR|nr:probable arsenite translocating ATPase [Chondrus crispus]CDF39347.1 probable arsenite translocating ATPase [Chondrus crispus]|eukprot:XP_005719258.1 probable arsenite translocating ATPase [Chondrus crispus]